LTFFGDATDNQQKSTMNGDDSHRKDKALAHCPASGYFVPHSFIDDRTA